MSIKLWTVDINGLKLWTTDINQAYLWSTEVFSAWAAAYHTKSVSLDGSTEYMANTSNNTIWITNAWTISMWIKPSSLATDWYIINIWEADLSNESRIFALLRSSWKVTLRVANDSWTTFKDLLSSVTLSTWTIYHVVMTFDWAVWGDPILLYFDAANDATPTWTDNTWATANRARAIGVWARHQWTSPFAWLLSEVAIWNVALDQTNITAIYNSWNWFKLDLTSDTWGYDQSAALQHQYPLGRSVAPDIWKDEANATDIDLSWVSVTDADITDFV